MVKKNIIRINEPSDTEEIKYLERVCYKLGNSQSRHTIHTLLHHQSTLMMLDMRDFADKWHGHFELDAFTVEDLWAKRVLIPIDSASGMPGLDYAPITYESERTVHLVVFGISEMAEALITNAALVAHYPNYIRDHRLRTRITVIDANAENWMRRFCGSYTSLMDNSYYRYIDIAEKDFMTHEPMYCGEREDFVDVEWEFVKGDIYDRVVQDKLLSWAENEDNMLSVAICHNDDNDNIRDIQFLTRLLEEYEVPMYVKQEDFALIDMMKESHRYRNVRPIGMKIDEASIETATNVNMQLLQMAKCVKYVYDYCYDHGESPISIDSESLDKHWLTEKTALKRYSCVCNAMTVVSKMRSLGHDINDWDTFYAVSKYEVELLAQVEHNRWCVEELLLGFRPCTEEETKEIEADINKKNEYKKRGIHYDLRSYSDLRNDVAGNDVRFYDRCLSASIPLIAYSVMKGGEE